MPGKQGSMLRVTRKTVVGPLVFSKAIASVGPRFQQVSYPIGFRIFLFAFLVSLSGCPFGTPGDRADHIFTMDRNGNSKEQLTDIDANDTSGKYSPSENGLSLLATRLTTGVGWRQTGGPVGLFA